jgi:hypothetical protein
MSNPKMLIDKIIVNTLTGGVLITTFKSKRQINIYKDKEGFFFYISKKMGVTQRIENVQEIERIESFLAPYIL